MKQFYVFTLLAISMFSCNETKNDEVEPEIIKVEEPKIDYPENLTKIFNAHGGLDKWNEMQALVFTMDNPEGAEVTLTDLKSRKSLIETDKFKIGFDGTEVWINQDSTYFKNDPKFYHNLMFYFYAMPFVLADKGITYSDAPPLEVDGKSYPGIKITYNDGVGDSPEDEYILYYNSANNRMVWLGYTVTYFSSEKSNDFHYIKYNIWQNINGISLPKTIQWYDSENGKITDMKKEVHFSKVKLMVEKPDEEMFMKPKIK